MNTGHLSTRYATALLLYAKENNTLEKLHDEAKMLTLMFSKVSEIKHALDNPVLPDAEKRKLILTAAGGNTSKTMEQFADLLLKNRRESQIQSIMLRFIELYRRDKNIHYCKLTTATTLDKDTEQRLVKFITGQTGGTLEFKSIIDPDVLGGFSLEVDNKLWDATLETQLRKIKSTLIDANKRIV